MNLSEPRLISPLLDGFVMGDPISNHDGVRSCPAMQLETEKKYIVKIVSLPASQAKLAALILAGAFADREAALAYFKELADGVLEETELLQRLAKFEGFVAFENWQMVPMEEEEDGFDIYLLGEYRPTLENVLRTNEMTHLQAVNMGLDLCTALSVARRNGYLYANLQPTNVYVCNEKEFRIGDLGFLNLNSLQFASLPDKYRSDYTPPEISDAFAALNTTMDTYAVGLLLYQAYNDGKLPPVGISMDAPRYADLQLSEIILKACAVNPEERWQDPVQMGQALANYMQSNTVNDTPIVPVPVEAEQPVIEEIVEEEENTEPSTEDILAEVDQALEAAPAIIPAGTEEVTEEVVEAVEESEPIIEAVEEDQMIEEAVAEEEIPEETAEEEPVQEEESISDEEQEASEEESCETIDETAEILAQADDLIAHQLPDPPVAPEPIEVTLPTTEETPVEEEPAEEVAAEEVESEEEENNEETEENIEEEEDDIPADQPKKRNKGLIAIVAALIAIIVLATASILFYQNYYCQTIHGMTLNGAEDKLTVTLTSDIPDEKLTIKCTGTPGNELTATLVNGVAQFTGLKPGTAYTLEVQISGFHKLLGKTTQTYITEKQTVISDFQATTGQMEGSVILNFFPSEPDSQQWRVHYSAEGEETKTLTFTGHTTPVTGLTVGKEYTFTLEPVTDLYLGGNNTITYTPTKFVYAEDLKILGFVDNQLAVTWTAPEDDAVTGWQIRCYNNSGYEKIITTTETTAYFDGIDRASAYIIEVSAEGTPKAVSTSLTANSVTISNIQADASDLKNLKVTWEFEGPAPAEGWRLLYTVDGSAELVVICQEASGVITPLIPGGHYTLRIEPNDAISFFGDTAEFDAPEAQKFAGYYITTENMTFKMCITPNKENWDRYDVPANTYTTTFAVGQGASFVMNLNRSTEKTDDNVTTLYVVRDAEGNLVSSATESRTWDDMWYNRYGKLTIPFMPELAGTYTVQIYFDGRLATTQTFEVTA